MGYCETLKSRDRDGMWEVQIGNIRPNEADRKAACHPMELAPSSLSSPLRMYDTNKPHNSSDRILNLDPFISNSRMVVYGIKDDNYSTHTFTSLARSVEQANQKVLS